MKGGPIDAYLSHLARRNLRNTYRYNQKLTLRNADCYFDGHLIEATTTDLRAYLDSRPLCPGARSAEVTHFRQFFGWAARTGIIEHNPSLDLEKPRHPRGKPRPVPDDAVSVALEHADGRVKAILLLALLAGLRSCEIAQLRRDDLRDGLVVVQESKGGDVSSVPMTPQLEDGLAQCGLPASGWLFPAERGQYRHLSRMRICQLANNHLRALGLPYTLHQWRHSYGSMVYRATGRDLRLTMELMRHRSVASTQVYTYLHPDEAASALARLPKFV